MLHIHFRIINFVARRITINDGPLIKVPEHVKTIERYSGITCPTHSGGAQKIDVYNIISMLFKDWQKHSEPPSNNSQLTIDNSRLTTGDSALTAHDSRLTTDDSRLTTDDSRLTTDDSRLTTHDSPLTTHDSPLTTHDSPLTTHSR
jgi:hypothetical protein